MADQDLSITTPSIAKSSTIATIGKSWGAVGPTGAASFELPLPLSAGRGWDPQLSLAYSSQAGNGPFGVGWSLGLGAISRRTHKGVPHYTAHDEIIGHDGQVWMPELDDNRQILSRRENRYNNVDIGPHDVVRYWPRVESDFALREYWQPQTGVQPGFWLIHGADGSLHLYGKSAAARRADPDDPLRVINWLLCESMNTHGEHIGFDYKADDQADEQACDPDRDCRAQRYLRAVFYGNASASQHLYGWTQESPAEGDWHFHLLFDYGERSTSLTEMPEYAENPSQPWKPRPDPFSTFGQGFELGTRRLCRQVLMFHHFAKEPDATPVLVRRLLFEYSPVAPQSPFSQLTAAHYQARDADGFVEDTPPIEFEHSPFTLDPTPRRLLELETQPGIDDQPYHCVDLFGEGLPGFLCRYDQCWYYREPLRASAGADAITYDAWTSLKQLPVANRNKAAQQLLTDLTGDGRLDWIIAMPGMSGFRTLNADRSWEPFTEFDGFPLEFFHNLSQLGDFSGDGLNSLAMIGPQAVRLYANRREAGFSAATEVDHLPVDDRLPLLSNARHELVFLGNLLGSDMTELCRIRQDEIRCWPNLGHGRFGKGRRISGPVFSDTPFDAARVRIADLDGSGAPALIYLNSDAFDIYLNRGGDGLQTEAVRVPWPAGVRYDGLCQVTFADLQGLGCASLILTIPHMTPRHWRYDFVSAKPYLLTASNNNMGCSSQVHYRSSAQAWLDEKYEQLAQDPGRIPACHLPFPMQLVSQQLQLDEVTGNRLTQGFEYREGNYDGREREFRGFGRLQQFDSESAAGDDDSGFTAPVRVCTWFHTGQAMERSREGYFNRDADAVALGNTLFSRYHPADECDEPMTPPDAATEYEIARALAGSVARSETWAGADDPATACPYAVVEHRYRVREVRPRGDYSDTVLLPLPLENISYAYERLADDPMCAHDITLCANPYGMPTHTMTLNYPRRRKVSDTPPYSDPDEQQWWRDAHDEAQQSWYLSETRSRYIDLDQDPQHWRLGLPWQQRGNALNLANGSLPDGLTPEQVCHEQLTQHQDSPEWNALRVLTLQSVQRYLESADQSALPDGEAAFEALAGPLEIAQLDKTALEAYANLPPPFDIRVELKNIGYTPMSFLFETTPAANAEQNLWSSFYNFAQYAGAEGFHRVLEHHQTPSHGVTKAQYDPYSLALIRVELPDGCTTRVEYDYHALQPLRIIDANDNVQEAIYEPSGQPLTTTFYGTENAQDAGFRPLSEYRRPEDHRPDPAIADPAQAVQKAASTLRKDVFSWMGQLPLMLREASGFFREWIDAGLVLPSGHIRASARRQLAQNSAPSTMQQALQAAIASSTREPVHSVLLSADRYPDDPIAAQFQIIKLCFDGFGRSLQTQQLVEPAEAYVVDENGALVVEGGKLLVRHADPRWRISERVEYNNKGLPVRQFRPFFADSHHYVNDVSLREHGYFDQLFYDVLGRPIRLINAKGYFSRETYHPWYHISEDFNDTDESEPQP
ncbi:SpvB/TcaC N-terminal domain-containing protein [Pseudomonas sp. H1h]|uniref:SpvB/TcaC N-terminal domain-containing protein n=1 Tax=Pseudomonas sp. H1h TaxID=1397280 RepID=UPI00046B0ABE|nr:SpvB/TcaC N-terminal domain-containing protein [Pseudomonas sp. H1h]